MRLKEIQIHNYKSLRNIVISPAPLSVFVGPNAAGKTNFSDALGFLGEAYQLGLEVAIASKGGYENICYRHVRRSKAPIRFRIQFEISFQALRWPPLRREIDIQGRNMIFEHEFEFLAKSQDIQSPFYVASEELKALLLPKRDNETERDLFRATRRGRKVEKFSVTGLREIVSDRFDRVLTVSELDIRRLAERFPETEFMIPLLERLTFLDLPFQHVVGSLRVFQLNPQLVREPGVPTPNPELDRFGANLPAVVAYLKENHRSLYALVLNTLRRVMPTLEELETNYTHGKRLGLFIKEKGISRLWAAEDISDGTIQTVALLVALFDPRISVVVIEEPENSIHPWALRNFVEAAREASKSKQIILTTHSPILIDQLMPDELWIVRRPGAETKIDPVLSLDSSLAETLGKGRYTLSEYLDSGAIPEAVPAS